MIDFDRERASSIELAQVMRRTTNVVLEMQVASYRYLFILFIFISRLKRIALHITLDTGVVSLLFHANKHKWRSILTASQHMTLQSR